MGRAQTDIPSSNYQQQQQQPRAVGNWDSQNHPDDHHHDQYVEEGGAVGEQPQSCTDQQYTDPQIQYQPQSYMPQMNMNMNMAYAAPPPAAGNNQQPPPPPPAYPPPQQQAATYPPPPQQAATYPPPPPPASFPPNSVHAFPPPQNAAFNYEQQQQQGQFAPANNSWAPQKGGVYHQNVQASPANGIPMAPATPSHRPIPVSGWNSGLFDCMDDPMNALITAFFPCLTFGQIAEIVDAGHTSCGTSGTLYSLIWFFLGMPFIMSCTYRTKLRSRYGLVESPAPDWVTHLLCEWCALCQEYRELQHRGYDPTIGWLGNQALQQQHHHQQIGMTPPTNQRMMG